MSIKLKTLKLMLICTLAGVQITQTVFAQVQPKVQASSAEIEKLRAAVEANHEDLKIHEAYIKAAGVESAEVTTQYEKWQKQFPKSAIIPYAIGGAYAGTESPKAKPYLLKAVKIDQKLAKAWRDLSIDAERWGQFDQSREYLKKATEAEPENPDYAFYYTMAFDDIDRTQYIQLTNELVKRFPESERGAQALYWMALRSPTVADKLKWFELLKTTYAPEKFNWSASGMTSYTDLLLKEDPERAVVLTHEMAGRKLKGQDWTRLEATAKTINDAKTLIDKKDGQGALNALKAIRLPKYFRANATLLQLRASATELVYGSKAAYDSLLISFAKAPSVVVKEQIGIYGGKSGRSSAEIETDIWIRLDAIAKLATPFTLKKYLTIGSASLSDYKGKVVLLTYWFPGCGPCRGEFPHFENVIKKFKGEAVDYIGINILPEQDDYVVPFMKSSKYSFTPLADVKGRAKGNMDNKGAAPANFLIDQDGRVLFSNFRTDGDNEDDLALMISLLLNRNKA
jgi:peroxiredoxin/tetratricopeptide (TPR) repeat protein